MPFSEMLTEYNPQWFYGRAADIEIILRGISAPNPRSYAIAGIRSIGKSFLLHFLSAENGATAQYHSYLNPEFQNKNTRLLFAYLKCGKHINKSDFFREMVIQIRNSINPHYNTPAFELEDLDLTQLIGEIRESLRKLSQQSTRMVFLLDDFDHIAPTLGDDGTRVLRSMTDERTAFVVTSERPLAEVMVSQESTLFLQILIARNIDLLDMEAAQTLITQPLEASNKRIFSAKEINFLIEVAGRQPYLLILAANQLYSLYEQYPNLERTLASADGGLRIISQIERHPSIQQTLQLIWEKLDENEIKLVRSILQNQMPDIRDMHVNEILRRLENKALIYQDLEVGKYYLFSELFGRFVVQQSEALTHTRSKITLTSLDQIREVLSPQDNQLFSYFVSNPNQICTFEELSQVVWNESNVEKTKNALDAAIYRLRQSLKLVGEEQNYSIDNVRGKGFRFVVQEK